MCFSIVLVISGVIMLKATMTELDAHVNRISDGVLAHHSGITGLDLHTALFLTSRAVLLCIGSNRAVICIGRIIFVMPGLPTDCGQGRYFIR